MRCDAATFDKMVRDICFAFKLKQFRYLIRQTFTERHTMHYNPCELTRVVPLFTNALVSEELEVVKTGTLAVFNYRVPVTVFTPLSDAPEDVILSFDVTSVATPMVWGKWDNSIIESARLRHPLAYKGTVAPHKTDGWFGWFVNTRYSNLQQRLIFGHYPTEVNDSTTADSLMNEYDSMYNELLVVSSGDHFENTNGYDCKLSIENKAMAFNLGGETTTLISRRTNDEKKVWVEEYQARSKITVKPSMLWNIECSGVYIANNLGEWSREKQKYQDNVVIALAHRTAMHEGVISFFDRTHGDDVDEISIVNYCGVIYKKTTATYTEQLHVHEYCGVYVNVLERVRH